MIRLAADRDDEGAPFLHHWSLCVGAGRANEGLRADWQAHLRRAKADCGFRYVRFHGLFHDDMFVLRHGACNFQYLDALFDALLDIGVRPFVELGFFPEEIAGGDSTIFWWKGRVAPPSDLSPWCDLVRRTLEHWIGRYGLDEVRAWYFEVWNEPNLRPFFDGTRSQYFELYRATVETIKAVSPELRVGGPATSNFVPDDRFNGETEDFGAHSSIREADDLDALDWRPVWVEAFLAFCAEEHLPVDFVSAHPYPTDWALDGHESGGRFRTRSIDSTRLDLARLRRIVDESAFPRAEIHLTEWNCSSSPRDHAHDHLQAATFVVKTNVESAGLADSLSYWTFTDVFEEGGAGESVFHGGFGMLSMQGVPKASYHAYRFLNALGGERLARAEGAVATRDRRTGKLAVLAYHYPPEVRQAPPVSLGSRDVAEATLNAGRPVPLRIELTLRPGASLAVETLDRHRGNALAAWQALGAPEPPTPAETAAIRRLAEGTGFEAFRADEEGRFLLEREIDPWSVVLVREL